MSGRYVTTVMESDLPKHLLATAQALATFAAEDGGRIWPSMDRVAWMTRQSVRTVQYHVRALLTMHVLELVRPATQHYPAHYRMVLARLPRRPAFEPAQLQFRGATVAPLADSRGATEASRGATQVAPDPPPLDPSQRARADARAVAADRQRHLRAYASPGSLPLLGRARRPVRSWRGTAVAEPDTAADAARGQRQADAAAWEAARAAEAEAVLDACAAADRRVLEETAILDVGPRWQWAADPPYRAALRAHQIRQVLDAYQYHPIPRPPAVTAADAARAVAWAQGRAS